MRQVDSYGQLSQIIFMDALSRNGLTFKNDEKKVLLQLYTMPDQTNINYE
jgi:hypothetical protein